MKVMWFGKTEKLKIYEIYEKSSLKQQAWISPQIFVLKVLLFLYKGEVLTTKGWTSKDISFFQGMINIKRTCCLQYDWSC